MKLLAAGRSPYVRKVQLTAQMKGLGGRLDLVSPDDPEMEALRAHNPLSKIPILFTEDGVAIYGRWRNTCPKMVDWLNGFAQDVPAFDSTTPQA